MRIVLGLIVSFCLLASSHAGVVEDLQAVSVTIKSGGSQGSGVLFTRQEGDETITFVFTAGHVVDNLRQTRDVIYKGSRKTLVEFKDASLVQEFKEGGRRIGQQTMDCRVLKFSDAEDGEDLALLEVRKRNFVPASVSTTFHEGEIPQIGTELYHVGSLLGQFGANSLTTGVISQIGRVLDLGNSGVVFDQVSTTGFPGSSGGGVFIKENGHYMGMLVRGAGETFVFVVPVRRMRAWAERNNILWAMDKSVPLPTDRERWSLPVEETSSNDVFGSSDNSKLNAKFPYLLNVND